MKVQLFATCLVESWRGNITTAAEQLLRQAGVQAHRVVRIGCCGQVAFNAGHWDAARKMAIAWLHSVDPATPLVMPSGSCAAMVRHSYALLLNGSPLVPSVANARRRQRAPAPDPCGGGCPVCATARGGGVLWIRRAVRHPPATPLGSTAETQAYCDPTNGCVHRAGMRLELPDASRGRAASRRSANSRPASGRMADGKTGSKQRESPRFAHGLSRNRDKDMVLSIESISRWFGRRLLGAKGEAERLLPFC